MFEFKLPDLGEGIAEGEILKWHVELGQTVAEDAPLVDVETDKAAVTIPSGSCWSSGKHPGVTSSVGPSAGPIVSTKVTICRAREQLESLLVVPP